MTRKAKHFVSDAEFAARSVELTPILAELGPLSDAAAAEVLNGRNIKTLGNGKRGWQGTQVARIRRRLDLEKDERRFLKIRAELIEHFGRAPAPPTDDHLIELTSWLAFALELRNANFVGHPVGQIPKAKIDPANVREFHRARAQLRGALELLRIASDVFGTAKRKSRAELILETADELAPELGEKLKPAIAVDTNTAGTA